MAEGRMIVKTISYDARIKGLSCKARELWPYMIPHAETNGTVPREAHSLRLMCYPDWDVSDQEVESAILEWLATRPPMATEIEVRGRRKLHLSDFEKSNWDLDFIKQRRYRKKTVTNVSDSSGQSVTITPEVKGSEVKRSKYIKTTTTSIGPSVQKREAGPIQQIVEAYKMAKNISRDDKGWDKQNFSRYAKAAKGLLDCFKGDISRAGAYVFAQGEEFDAKDISWTLETIARHAWDNKGKLDEHKPSTLDADSLLEQSRPAKAPQERGLAYRSSKPVRPGEIHLGEYGKLDGPGNDLEP